MDACRIQFQIDTASEVNTICKKDVKESQVKPTDQKLTMWNHTKFHPIGEAKLPMTNPLNKKSVDVQFTVIRIIYIVC